MKTNQFKTRIQYCIFLLTLSFIIFNCTHENIENENSERYTTVEISKTLDFLNKKNTTDTKNLSRSNSNFINEIDDANITLESISNTDAKLTIIPAKTGFDNHFSRIVALNIDGEIKTNIVHSYPNENSNDEKFSGEIIVTDLNGIFITGFRINNGLIISKYLKNNNETLASRSSSNDDNCRNECGHSPSNGSCICNMQFTDEVVIVSQNPWQYVSISTIYPQDGGGDVDTCEIGCYGWDIGGGGASGPGDVDVSENNCGDGYTADANGFCVADWPEDLVLFDDISDPKINDIKEYLECFDKTKPATITMYVDQPTANSSETWSGWPTDPDVGHTFVGITQGDITRIFGFYPSGSVSPFDTNPSTNSSLNNNSGHSFDVSISKNITSLELTNIISMSENFIQTYNLNSYNCTDFGLGIINSLGLNIPDTSGTWPGGGGSNPGNLGQDIRSLILPTGLSRNASGGNASNNNGSC